MAQRKNLFLLSLSIASIASATLLGGISKAGSQGVDIYCVMRNGGNDHDSSWQAAYISLKNERGGFFKISPRQAATIIVQQVVGDPGKYEDCIPYLGELYPKSEEMPSVEQKSKINPKTLPAPMQEDYINDRYSY